MSGAVNLRLVSVAIPGLLWAALPAAADPPDKGRIVVVCEEQVRGVFGLSGTWVDPGQAEAAVIKALLREGYTVVDAQTLRANLSRDQAVRVLAGDEKAAVAVGGRFQARHVLVGKGYAKSAGQVLGSSMQSMQGQVSLTLMDAESGAVLATAAGSAAKPHVDEVTGGTQALAEAGGQAVARLLDALRRIEAAPAAGRGALQVSISGLRSYRHYLFIKDWIGTHAAGFEGIEDERYTAGTAEFSLRAAATGQQFAEQMARAAFEGFVVNPVDVADRSVTLKVIVQGP